MNETLVTVVGKSFTKFSESFIIRGTKENVDEAFDQFCSNYPPATYGTNMKEKEGEPNTYIVTRSLSSD